mmetsp:Transcript_4894/g.7421  ORF Transcript_4894/g.7421 Transcript_4894/m.7421 type:complete len:222 (+) Transcript_4894:116-781(+)|eukprot:CAMPEP_0195300750 /NCGR_PEP_ID=MMETSP0707-20130614/28070_1 /TAXON_ID=33640 /ORGANISM="Asterionellopsis glacialis, Strain CCMP134" /LENGTH=221 /DNA_ID=CAMNT_0040363531 /DNA_START=76 /DNA_END=741 /DNA_ORIENTATION=+
MSDELWKITKDGVSRFVSEAPAVWKGRNAEDYASEKALANDVAQPIVWGLSSGVICFIGFRVSSSRFVQYLRTGGRTTATKRSAGSKEWKGSMERQHEKKANELREAASIPIDFALSVLIGLTTTGVLYEPDKLMKDFVRVPLLPGRSVASEILCPDIGKAFRKLEDKESVDAMYKEFVTNCASRAKQEAAIREKNGLLDDQPVSIPEPGVVCEDATSQCI